MATPVPRGPAAAALCLLSCVSAQGGLEVLPGRMTGPHPGISAVYRYVDSQAGRPPFEALQRYDRAHFQGVGDLTNTGRGKSTGACEVAAVRVRYQDEDGATSEGFTVVARPAGATPGSPDPGKTLFTQSVPGWPATKAGPAGLLVTVQVMSGPSQSAFPVPCQESFFCGVQVPAVPAGKAWPYTDGLALAVSLYAPRPGYPVADWPKGGNAAPALAHVIAGTPPVVTTMAPRGSFGFALLPDATVLQLGAAHRKGSAPHGADTGFGAAGIWPEVDPTTARGRQSADGVVARISDPRLGAGTYTLFYSPDHLANRSLPPLPVTGLGGAVYLAPPITPAVSGALNAPDTEIPLAPPGSLPVTLIGNAVYLQALVTVGGRLQLSNMVGVVFR